MVPATPDHYIWVWGNEGHVEALQIDALRERQGASYGLRVTSCERREAGSELWVTGYELREARGERRERNDEG